MKILALSDIHSSFNQLVKVVSSVPCDCVFIAGDLTTHGTVEDVEKAFEELTKRTSKVYAVAGNMDSEEIDNWLNQRGYGLNCRGLIINDVGICGVSAAPHSILHTPYEVSEETILKSLQVGWEIIKEAKWKIIISHSPPKGTKLDKVRLGMHVGSTALREFIGRNKPDLVVCGHIHEAYGVDKIGNTLILNCGPVAQGRYGIIEVGEELKVKIFG